MHEVTKARQRKCCLEKRSFCVSDMCMAWRWGELKGVSQEHPDAKTCSEVIKCRPDLKDSLTWGNVTDRHFLLQGYCGLAGKND